MYRLHYTFKFPQLKLNTLCGNAQMYAIKDCCRNKFHQKCKSMLELLLIRRDTKSWAKLVLLQLQHLHSSIFLLFNSYIYLVHGHDRKRANSSSRPTQSQTHKDIWNLSLHGQGTIVPFNIIWRRTSRKRGKKEKVKTTKNLTETENKKQVTMKSLLSAP